LPALEFVATLSVGIASDAELAVIETGGEFEAASFVEAMNLNLPDGIQIGRAENYLIKQGIKKHSLSSLLWGFEYSTGSLSGCSAEGRELVRPGDEKKFREHWLEYSGSLFGLKRLGVLATPRSAGPELQAGDAVAGESYFDVYRDLYPEKY
jgi:hypothetical protein